ncbi:MAG: dTDP-4-dehydrorhamnose 3,5-epimerase family protein [Planctomycetes bacterium]|nr:dTDP-4-dehydrorhamnose 3,5-epimerase family protein [Planctomycetota bacterium]
MRVQGAAIAGVEVLPSRVFRDPRGWLIEIFRRDEGDPRLLPAMGYVSMTRPGMARGPHEHAEQTDRFFFGGPSVFRLTMWDNRADSPTFQGKMVVECGSGAPAVVVIPPGVVHAYRNIGAVEGLVFNCPDRLYAGEKKKGPVDEIRHEDDPDSPFQPE